MSKIIEMKKSASQKKIQPFASVWYEIGLLSAMITYLKSAEMLLFKYYAKGAWGFQKSYNT